MSSSESDLEVSEAVAEEDVAVVGVNIVSAYASPGINDRLQRIQDRRMTANFDPSTSRAVLVFVAADLLETEAHLGEALRRVLAECPASIDEIEKQRGPIDLMIRLSKQIAQITLVDMQVTKKEASESSKPR